MRELLARLRDWLHRDRLDRELTEELAFHRAYLERDARAQGLDPDEAARAARRRLGNLPRTQEAARERWSVPWLEHLLHDVRYALRGLRRSPGFTLGAVVTLGLGIGANAAMLGLIDRLMFRPHPYLIDPGTVHRVYLQYRFRDREITTDGFEYTRYLDLQHWSTAFSHYAAFHPYTSAVGLGEAARERRIAPVSASFWDFFNAPPVLGRYFGPAEDQTPVGEPVAVLSYEFWMAEFGGGDVLGQTLQVANVPCTIIGVTPKGFLGVSEDNPPVVYLPITTWAGSQAGSAARPTYYRDYSWGWMEMMVRRKPGVSLEAATADLTSAYLRSWNKEREMEPAYTMPAELARPRAIPGPLKNAAGPDPGLEARTVLWVTGVAVLVLLIACANVANLFLARALKRRREVALRVALGVSRGRLVAQSLTESLTLSLLGCAVGLAVAQWGGLGVRRLFLENVAGLDLLTDARTLAVALGAALLAALITGVVPVLFAGHPDVGQTLKAGVREGTYQRSRARTAMLVAQCALSAVLLVGAGLFVRSLSHVRDMGLGFNPEPVLFVSRNLRGMALSDDEQIALGRRLLETGQAIPGVERAAWVSSVPFWSTSSTALFVAGIDSVAKLGRFRYQTATTDYFTTMGTRILRGRGFEPGDRAGAPRVAVVSESMARVLWPGRNAIGECMRVRADTMPCTTVVGIAEDAVQESLTEEQLFRYYLPIEQDRPASGFALMLRMRGDPALSVEPVRRALQVVMPGQSYVTVRPFREVIDGQRRSWRVGATMFVAFGGLALLISAVGLYGVIAYNVTQRLHEVGVRIALGARVGDVLRLIMGQGIRFALAGVGLGSVLALIAGRWVEPLLFRQSARDPAVYALVGALLVMVAVFASSLPALRAARADPNSALRAE